MLRNVVSQQFQANSLALWRHALAPSYDVSRSRALLQSLLRSRCENKRLLKRDHLGEGSRFLFVPSRSIAAPSDKTPGAKLPSKALESTLPRLFQQLLCDLQPFRFQPFAAHRFARPAIPISCIVLVSLLAM